MTCKLQSFAQVQVIIIILIVPRSKPYWARIDPTPATCPLLGPSPALAAASFCLSSNNLSDAASRLLLFLPQISPQNLLQLLLRLSLALTPITFPPTTASTGLRDWVKLSSRLPGRVSYFRVWASLFCPKHQIEGLHCSFQ